MRKFSVLAFLALTFSLSAFAQHVSFGSNPNSSPRYNSSRSIKWTCRVSVAESSLKKFKIKRVKTGDTIFTNFKFNDGKKGIVELVWNNPIQANIYKNESGKLQLLFYPDGTVDRIDGSSEDFVRSIEFEKVKPTIKLEDVVIECH